MDDEIDYVLSGKPFRRSDGKVFQNGSALSLHNGFWWWDAGCAIAPEGQEVNLPLIDLEPNGTPMAAIEGGAVYVDPVTGLAKVKKANRTIEG